MCPPPLVIGLRFEECQISDFNSVRLEECKMEERLEECEGNFVN